MLARRDERSGEIRASSCFISSARERIDAMHDSFQSRRGSFAEALPEDFSGSWAGSSVASTSHSVICLRVVYIKIGSAIFAEPFVMVLLYYLVDFFAAAVTAWVAEATLV